MIDPRERLVAAGLRVTAQRVAVLESIPTGAHADADQVAQAVRARIGSVSTQAVYDVLRALTTAGLLRRIQPSGKPALFEIRVADNHHHLVCRACGDVVDVDCVTGQAPCLDAADLAGFAVDEAEVIFWGLCPDCVTRAPEVSTAQAVNER